MKYLLMILLMCGAAHAEALAVAAESLPDSPSAHHFVYSPFWTPQSNLEFGILAGLVAADAITTQRGLDKGLREANPVMRPFVTRGAAGEAAGSALGFGAAMGTVYLLHRTHHYKAERITMRLFVAGESAFVANNIALIR